MLSNSTSNCEFKSDQLIKSLIVEYEILSSIYAYTKNLLVC